MSFSTRTQIQDSEIIQDVDQIDHSLDNEGDNLSATAGRETLSKLARNTFGMMKLVGEKNRRRGSTKFNGADINLAGTITSSGAAVTGSGSAFVTELEIGDFISGTDDEFREVQSITDNNNLTLVAAFTADISTGQAAKRISYLAERLDAIGLPLGYMDTRLAKNGTNPPSIKSGQVDVRDKSVRFVSDQALSFATHNYGSPSSDTYQWYYVVVNSIGAIRTHIAPGVAGVTGLVVSSITNPGGSTFRYNFSGSPDLSSVVIGEIFEVNGCTASANDGVFVVIGVDDTTDYIEVANTNGVIQGTAAGTGAGHGLSGGATSATEDANGGVNAYTPIPIFLDAWNSYESDFLPSYRILGIFYVDASSAIKHIISYGHGRNKRDNYAFMTADNGSSGAISAMRALNFTRVWGDGLTISDDTTDGTKITVNVNGLLMYGANFTSTGVSGGVHGSVRLYRNGIAISPGAEYRGLNNGSSNIEVRAGITYSEPVVAGDYFQFSDVSSTNQATIMFIHAQLEAD